MSADAATRDRIRTDLETNMLVEAGAGSGKTTELVNRMVALVRRGVPVSRIAAVTFTRKAAGQLTERFREELEKAYRQAVSRGDLDAPDLDRALAEIDHGFVGTIHAFCARLLRQNPLAARVDPGFVELGPSEERRVRTEFWSRYVDELHARDDPLLKRLRELGIKVYDLGPRIRRPGEEARGEVGRGPEAFRDILEDPDVEFPATPVALPDFASARKQLDELVTRGCSLLPPQPLGTKGWDDLQSALRRLRFLRQTTDWSRPTEFFAALEELASKPDCTYNRWVEKEGTGPVKDLKKAIDAFMAGPGGEALASWYAHRYPVVLEFLLPLREAFAEHRRLTGQLTFQDLLTLAADLLRRDAEVRRWAGERYQHLLVDEFQDTDPLQAEICFLLASAPEEGNDWRHVVPRPGALFVVGDPKQSIYRFRRADIQIYNLVRERFAVFGDVLPLTLNYRSLPAIGAFADAAFKRLFGPAPTEEQAAFAPLNTTRAHGTGRVWRYAVDGRGKGPDRVGSADARIVANWIADRIESGANPGDFLVLPYLRASLASYARELERRNIAVTTTGAGLTVERELRELLLLLEALADPDDAVATVAVLEGLFFGIDPQALWDYARDGRRLSFDQRELDETSSVGKALATLRRWFRLCRRLPADSALAQIVHEIGLVPLAAGGDMAESRAGSLVHVLDIVAAAARYGHANLRSAIEAIEGAMESADVEAPLQPGRRDAVRVMNLHKAKGLQAKIVILPHPTGLPKRERDKHIERGETDRARGWIRFARKYGQGERTIAQPAEWDLYAARENRFREAEHRRVLYVATTRAEDELVIAVCTHTTKTDSPWCELEKDLAALAEPLVASAAERYVRATPKATFDEATERIVKVGNQRAHAAQAAYAVSTVTALSEEDFVFQGSEGRGRDWGTIVHEAVAAMGRGRSGEDLRRYCQALVRRRAVELGGNAAGEMGELMALLDSLRASRDWERLMESPDRRWELAIARLETFPDALPVLVTGTVDAVGIAQEGEPWQVVDWKTDAVEGEEWSTREAHYRQQVEKYAEILGGLAGVQVRGQLSRLR